MNLRVIMMLRRIGHFSRLLTASLAVCGLLCLPSLSLANNNQGANNGGNNNGGNNANNNNNNNGAGAGFAGVRIDAAGTLRVTQSNPMVTMAQLRAAKQNLPQRLAKPSKLRKVSLTRLEKAISERLSSGEAPTPEMVALAGMTKLEYVFCYPESGDIVIAGPAEGFGRDSEGRVVGVESGKPCLLLDDLIVALRAYAPNGDSTNVIGVSIDPTQEGLARMQQTLNQLGTSFRGAADIPVIVNSLRTSLGLNEVTITGIPAGTHFAHVLTEADYRMKLIGIGLQPTPVPMQNYVSRLTATMTSSNALVRWFFVPDYQALATSEDEMAMKLVGQGVQLVGEDELVGRDGSRKQTARPTNPASRGFTSEFTKKFGLIADNSPVYSQLRNLVDMSIAAAFMQDRDYYGKTGWNLGVFGDEDQLPVQVFPAPRQVETAINAVMKGNRLITPIGGGVKIQPRQALSQENLGQADDSLAEQRQTVGAIEIPEGQWWWD
ncbi:MAG: DUF1598 domain-containing protein [bacterium]|nr:DUF1598 domain-containing protein [bacterium]